MRCRQDCMVCPNRDCDTKGSVLETVERAILDALERLAVRPQPSLNRFRPTAPIRERKNGRFSSSDPLTTANPDGLSL